MAREIKVKAPLAPWVIEAEKLTKQYDGRNVVDSIDFKVNQGECFGILGPNGAGKSTTLRMIIGLSPVDQGKLNLFGLPMSPEQRSVSHRLGVVPQSDNLDIDLTVEENLNVYARYFGLNKEEIRTRVQKLLVFAQLEERGNQEVRQLSGGMQRRLVIARSLIAEPEMVVLDEPTTGLDPQARHLIWGRLRALRKQGITLLLTTHYMNEAAQLCDRIMILDHGKILETDTPNRLLKRHVEPEVVVIMQGKQHTPEEYVKIRAAIDPIPCRVEQVADSLYCYTDEPALILDKLTSFTDITYLRRQTNLEDVFLKLTGRDLRD